MSTRVVGNESTDLETGITSVRDLITGQWSVKRHVTGPTFAEYVKAWVGFEQYEQAELRNRQVEYRAIDQHSADRG